MTALLPEHAPQERTVSGDVIFALLTGQPLDDDPWQSDALCAQTNPEEFFPERGGSARPAKSVCAQCPVRRECLDYALDNDERFGVWGGLSEYERRHLRRNAA